MCTSKERFVEMMAKSQRDCRDFKHYIGEDFNRLLQNVKQILSGEPLNLVNLEGVRIAARWRSNSNRGHV
ncbi:hypothetical protein T11_4421 [Trichinella zimbabwensis]|uniref:Uncharacterized protein n=1 Tax=Trichinella zimbabwensis TaxID=268475 RepID=A0A0V1G8B6_9BILA|nr:hypothetical protein T11_4421 [Trichinella zimbabwensis]